MPNINECGVKVLYPLDVQCSVVNPTTPTSSDGSATLIISGGTPPYTILWDNGNISDTITNLMGGEYSASITDYYGDFVINTTCVLTQPQPTTTTTTTTTTAQPTYNLCMIITQVNELNTTFLQIPFIPNGLYLGYQSWLSEDTDYLLYWDQTITSWKLSGSTLNVVSPDSSYPPLNGWQLLGGNGSVSVSQGECSPLPITTFTYTTTNPTCTCDGGIVIQATGVNTPFQYSINGGLNYYNNPVFTNLCGGTYPLVVKDSLGNTYTDSAILNSVIPTITYTLQPNESNSGGGVNTYLTYGITVNPPLPPGVVITFDLTLTNDFTRTPYVGSATNNFGYQLTKSSIVIPEDTSSVVDTMLTNTITVCNEYMMYKTTTTKFWGDLTIQSGESYQLTSSSNSTLNCGYTEIIVPLYELDESSVNDGISQPLGFDLDENNLNCCRSTQEISPTITNIRIEGCECCNAVLGWDYVYNRS